MGFGIADVDGSGLDAIGSAEAEADSVADDSGIADFATDADSSYRDYKLMNAEYTDNNGKTVVHLFVRDSDGTLDHVEVVDHNPSFYIRDEAYDARVDNHYAVSHCETHDDSGERYTTLHGEPLVRVYTHTPDGVGEFREQFDDHYEADVMYTNRFLIDSGIHTGVRIDTADADDECYHGDYRVSYEAVEPLSVDATPTIDAKMLAFDIEVGSEDGVPSTDKADWPVTTIVAWDNYTEEYRGWMYAESEAHEDAVDRDETGLDELTIYRDESEMLDAFNQFVRGERPDILTGWFSNDFDIPYVLNRCKNLNVYSYRDWSPLGDVYESKYEPVVKGVACVDMLGAYQKTQIHKLDSKKLDAIAEKELGKAKLDVADGHTEMWRDDPTQFLEYNRVDVELVHRIDDESGATDLLDNLRAVVGCSWTDPIGGNIDMMDILFLRKAQEYGYVLPTAQKPEVGDFHGAYVYTPQAGLHEHVVYPDYSSLYPNMMYQCNISPETLVGTKDDLEQSDYDEDDCVWSYIDTSTQPSEKPDTEADESDMAKVYFLKPSVQEGFIRSVLDDVMGLADAYTGGMYAAVKRVRNSTYGVMGDSDSYNSGFRLFDWRLAEATTLGGQRVLKEGGRQFATWIDDADAEVVYGDTDSVVTTIPNADDPQAALDMARDAGEQLNEYLDEYAADQFGLESEADARMEIEIETYARAIFFKGQNDGRADDGIKKRYVQATMWDDDDLWDVGGGKDQFELLIKGFEYVRSDVAKVTKDVQEYIFDTIMEHGNTDEAEELVKMFVSDTIRDAINGEMDDGRFGVPFGISQSLDQYGQDGRGMPWYHGAKHANEYLYGGDAISSGDKPLYYYIQEGITGDGVPKTYRADDAAKGDPVDCIAVQSADDVPNGMLIDRPKMVRKTIVDPIEAIVRTLGWGVSWLEQTIDDATPAAYYRDSGQSGLEKFEASEAM